MWKHGTVIGMTLGSLTLLTVCRIVKEPSISHLSLIYIRTFLVVLTQILRIPGMFVLGSLRQKHDVQKITRAMQAKQATEKITKR